MFSSGYFGEGVPVPPEALNPGFAGRDVTAVAVMKFTGRVMQTGKNAGSAARYFPDL